MTEHLKPMSFHDLFKWVITEFEDKNSIFSIPSQWFFKPSQRPLCSSRLFGRELSTPIGPAAGPHTQMAQNIISAWLCGARYIELKTVQVLDELDIPRPCIDATDEGYNVEWSQELNLKESASEYINAWVMIHLLKHLLRFPEETCETVFNMSVGYNLEGLQSEPMVRFLGTMKNASAEIDKIRAWLKQNHPELAEIPIPEMISDNVTLSTMHGCPPDEIQKIGEHLLQSHNLHTLIKLNPTLLGKESVLSILHDDLGFSYIEIPDSVFAADPAWEQALEMIRNLEAAAIMCNRQFGIKLSNTLAMRNVLERLPGHEMYMSGRALYPVTINLFARLQAAFDNRLKVSYSAGADAWNIAGVVAAGAFPVTVATDLLKPGGYGRQRQYIENIENAMIAAGASSLQEFQAHSAQRLRELAKEALVDPKHKKSWFRHGLPKLESQLTRFDCVIAPCAATCPAGQNPPAYIRKIASGDLEAGFHSIIRQNPLPGMTGYVCPHTCQEKCTRNGYDQPVSIRKLKRFIRDHARPSQDRLRQSSARVAIVGSGPAGLSAAAFLAENGVLSTIFEASGVPGGIPRIAPGFRIPEAVVQTDVDRILAMGVELKLNHPLLSDPGTLIKQGFDAVFLGTGFQKDVLLDIPGAQGAGVVGVLEFLALTKEGECWGHAKNVVVIGGGNAAMDAARTAARLTGHPSTVVYRRTRNEMPAWEEEIVGLLEENSILLELMTPVAVRREEGFPVSLTCIRNELTDPGPDGRRQPVAVPGSEIEIAADLIVVAIGQKAEHGPMKGVLLGQGGEIRVNAETGETGSSLVFAGGDVVRGPSSIIEAIADGERAARAILRELELDSKTIVTSSAKVPYDSDTMLQSRIRLSLAEEPEMLSRNERSGFDVVEQGLRSEQSLKEAERCLQCDLVCDRCVDVCPNRANFALSVIPRTIHIPSIRLVNNRASFDGETSVSITQNRQILHIEDWCNECGNCSTFCTHTGEPFREKPAFYLDRQSFEKASGDAWFTGSRELERKVDGLGYKLQKHGSDFICRIGSVTVTITEGFQVRSVSGELLSSETISLKPAVEMMILWDGILDHPIARRSV